MRSETVLVTPEQAAIWLRQNDPKNRRLNSAHVTELARQMRDGRWRLTHQGIAFNRDGLLTDGQHRLAAIVRSGVSTMLLVFVDCDEDYDAPIDQGSVRTAGQVLHKSTKYIAALRGLSMLENNSWGNGGRLANAELLELSKRYDEEIQTIYSHGSTTLPGGIVSALVFALPIAPERITKLASQIYTGEMLSRGDPAYTLRGWLAHGPKHSTADVVLAGCSAARSAITQEPVASMYVAKSGYHFLVTKRRVLRLPNTPGPDLVPSR